MNLFGWFNLALAVVLLGTAGWNLRTLWVVSTLPRGIARSELRRKVLWTMAACVVFALFAFLLAWGNGLKEVLS